jgi:N-acetylneuraminic acid mutarotase
MNLAAHGGKIYRIGGMQPRNAPAEEADNHSIADCDCFDPAAGKWSPIPALPEPRSSHDVAIVGDKLFVIGGWNMRGEAGNDWLKNALYMDLATSTKEWNSIEQPFERRALIVAVHQGKIYVLGGFDEADEPSLKVDILDPSSGKWTSGPNLPDGKMNGFAPAACTLNGDLFVSVADGGMHRLNSAENRWDKVASTTPRIVHRLVPHDSKILVIGGATRGDNLSLIEAVSIKQDSKR